MTIDKTFDPAAIEARWYAHWETEGRFRPERPEAEPYTIVIPPPNVTGSLHIGHALDNTLQDILIRHARLQGKDALWVVGTDHAGIATQMVVERQMNAAGEKRTDLTREQFVDRVWEWKEESGGTITRQLRRLGASCDWANERFTMDPGFSKAVIKVFVDLHAQGLLYRDKRLVNWDPGLKTAISDLEVETRELWGEFWHFKYPLADGSGFIEVATTRPETMLADMAVAVNPDDDRYKALVGKMVRLPITNRLIPVIEDQHADPELGSGAVKITPGHDFNDFEVGRRAGIHPANMLNMLDASANVVQTADDLVPTEFLGLDRFEARRRVSSWMEQAGLLTGYADARLIPTPFGDRSGVVIEPWLTDQWYVDAKTLAGPAIEAVRSGAIRVVPETWKKTWYQWLENIQPWCVSRQLWWGHRIPAWYGPTDPDDWQVSDKIFVAQDDQAVREQAERFYEGREVRIYNSFADYDSALDTADSAQLNAVAIWRDDDVLDTWFSSALWPFATLGWPEQSDPPRHGEGDQPQAGGGAAPPGGSLVDSPLHHASHGPPPRSGEDRGSLVSRHYPNDVLVSGFDILFFWDARMAMQGLHFMKEVPWKTLYLHGLVRAPDGSKMSKSKGNTVDPLGLIDRYGADALRFTLAAMESQGRDIKLDEKRVEGYRNFATKLWNAARFAQANGIGASTTLEPPAADLPVNRWIVAETVKTVQALDLALADLRFDEAANTIYQFAWATFCDWYLELIKPVFAEGADADAAAAAETRAVAGWVLDQILVVLHPFMPFITEELWHALATPPARNPRESGDPQTRDAGGVEPAPSLDSRLRGNDKKEERVASTRPYDLILAKWPMVDARAIDPQAQAEIDWLVRLVSAIRAVRAELNIPPSAKADLCIGDQTAFAAKVLSENGPAIQRLARVAQIRTSVFVSSGARVPIIIDGDTFFLPLDGVVDLAAERARLARTIAATAKELAATMKKLDNPSFVERAKPEVVEENRERLISFAAEIERLEAALARLG